MRSGQAFIHIFITLFLSAACISFPLVYWKERSSISPVCRTSAICADFWFDVVCSVLFLCIISPSEVWKQRQGQATFMVDCHSVASCRHRDWDRLNSTSRHHRPERCFNKNNFQMDSDSAPVGDSVPYRRQPSALEPQKCYFPFSKWSVKESA